MTIQGGLELLYSVNYKHDLLSWLLDWWKEDEEKAGLKRKDLRRELK